MNLPDKIYDTCIRCKQTIKSFHGSFHQDGGCEIFSSHDEYIEAKEIKGTFPVFQEYIPEMLTLKKDTICAAIDALKCGLEYAEECLFYHDRNFGRTIARNKNAAEDIERDILKIKKSIEELKNANN